MHPQAFLKTFWRMELRPQVFVAMSFASQYQSRYDSVIAPAISSLTYGTERLKPYRVDLSKSGDSILTDMWTGLRIHSSFSLTFPRSARTLFQAFHIGTATFYTRLVSLSHVATRVKFFSCATTKTSSCSM